MSADEIRRLAEPLCRDRAVSVYNKSLDEFLADLCITLKYRHALLDYAAMVERGEEVIGELEKAKSQRLSIHEGGDGDYDLRCRISEINYILHGDAVKEER